MLNPSDSKSGEKNGHLNSYLQNMQYLHVYNNAQQNKCYTEHESHWTVPKHISIY